MSKDVVGSKILSVKITAKRIIMNRCDFFKDKKTREMQANNLNLQFVEIGVGTTLAGDVTLIGPNSRGKLRWDRIRGFDWCHLENISLNWSNIPEPKGSNYIRNLYWWWDIP